MPNHDGGHYFLTVLAPIIQDSMPDRVTGRSRSHRHLLQQELALLDTGQQTGNSPPGAISPFARNSLNHFARFVLIDQPNFNGRLSGGTLQSLARSINPLTPQPVDRLGSPFLLFAADIDAPGDAAAALHAYTDALWATMRGHDELGKIFSHCVGFDRVATAEDFHKFITQRQVETTMPFNDYWADGLDVSGAGLPTAQIKRAAVPLVVAYAIALAAAAAHGGLWTFVLTLTLLPMATIGVIIWLVYSDVIKRGAAPFPTAPESDLPSVLKALFVQQNFITFASEAQGLSDAALFKRFGAFLDAVRPTEAAPAQAPGTIRSPDAGWRR
jgi:hypothetical protein